MAGTADKSRFVTAKTASDPASSRSRTSRLWRNRPQMSCAATSEMSDAAVSTATCRPGLR
jgi:hypothetical protein